MNEWEWNKWIETQTWMKTSKIPVSFTPHIGTFKISMTMHSVASSISLVTVNKSFEIENKIALCLNKPMFNSIMKGVTNYATKN